MKSIFAAAVAMCLAATSAKVSLADLVDKQEQTAPAQTNILTSDFLTGFQSGIFLREKENEIKEYGCPKASVQMEEFRKFKEMLPAVTTMLTVMKNDDPEMKNMLESLQLFVNHLDELVGVFDQKYTGGDFCAGLTFGQAGSNLLYKMASMVIHQNLKGIKAKKVSSE